MTPGYYEKNKERIKQASRERYWKKRDEILQQKSLDRVENPEKYRLKYQRDAVKAREYSRKRYREDPNREKNSRLLREYGISLEVYDNMRAKQADACAICGESQPQLCVDHDHETGAIRALLCHGCNLAVGNLRDKPELCVKAAEYLRSFGR